MSTSESGSQQAFTIRGEIEPAFIAVEIRVDEPDFAAQSLDLYKQAYSLARELDDKVGMARSLGPRHHFLDYWPAYRDEALANTEEALALSREIGDAELIIDSLTALYRCQRLIFGPTATLEE